ncbi:hypothetical protein UFOVP75_227 [uncultured Caudovirales phage]|uniref:Uncharacterized protein n=1 Tax=uncultured Caudovirales phage TaxID=2100421 RepID=A0A6J5L6H6_9CAUD|nr:hypothetical protein UFOVP75_227 [uncultured Caudovirales phage]
MSTYPCVMPRIDHSDCPVCHGTKKMLFDNSPNENHLSALIRYLKKCEMVEYVRKTTRQWTS